MTLPLPVPATFAIAQRRIRSFLYVIERPDTGALKIGFTQNAIAHRLSSIQAHNDVELRLVLYVRAHKNTEREMHRALGMWHKRGEWFHPSPEVLNWLRRQLDVCSKSRHVGRHFVGTMPTSDGRV